MLVGGFERSRTVPEECLLPDDTPLAAWDLIRCTREWRRIHEDPIDEMMERENGARLKNAENGKLVEDRAESRDFFRQKMIGGLNGRRTDRRAALEQYREYLALIARVLSETETPTVRWIPSDVAQEALLKAHQMVHQCKGKTEAEFRAWLRTILLNTLKDQCRPSRTETECQAGALLEAAIEQSSSRLEEWLGDSSSGPEAQMMKEELLDQIARAINQLPENQRTAVELFHIHRYTVAEIGQEMGFRRSGRRADRAGSQNDPQDHDETS